MQTRRTVISVSICAYASRAAYNGYLYPEDKPKIMITC